MIPSFNKILVNLATDYFVYIIINVFIRSALKYARDDSERKKIWRHELGFLVLTIGILYIWENRLSSVLIILAFCSYFVSQGMSVVEGVLQIALFSLGLLQAILAYCLFLWLTIWPLIQNWVCNMWDYVSYKCDRVSSAIIPNTVPPSYWPRGLVNQGNNLCFINTVFQCLSRIPYFTTELNRSLARTDGALMAITRPERPIALSVAKLLKELEVGDGMTMSQNNFRLAASRMNPLLVSPPIIGAKQSQQDVAEFTMWLLAVLHNAINIYQDNGGSCYFQNEVPPSMASLQSVFSSTERQKIEEIRQRYLLEIGHAESLDDAVLLEPLKKMADFEWEIYGMTNKSVIDQMFTGQMAELHQCLACHRISVHIQNFTLLPVAIPVLASWTSFSLEDCLRQFDAIEQLDGNNSLQCDCAVSMQKLSEARYDRKRKQGHKVHTAVVLNQNGLDLTSVALKARVKTENQLCDNTLYRYQLLGFCLHEGGENTTYGHYIAYAPDNKGNWYKLEDESVQKILVDKQLNSREVQQNVYLVFYCLKK